MRNASRDDKQVARWLLAGVFMIVIQVLIGGITRLTESGLSITEWKPITGTLPPLNETDWRIEFEKYMQTDQFKYVHHDFTLKEFKFIFFWEWFHRVWARLLGLVFLVGFIYFLVRKKLSRNMVLPLVVLFVLGGMQGAIGWIMVQSGLVPEKFYVGHVELTTHLIAAIILLAYTLWFALSLLPSFQSKLRNKNIRGFLLILVLLVTLQLIYGGFMAGLKAAASAPTWPLINGYFVPASMNEIDPWHLNLVNNNLMVHFIHRGLAYVILLLSIIFLLKSSNTQHNLFNKYRIYFLSIVFAQVVLGILTVLNSTDPTALAWFGVAHQFAAMLLVMVLVALLYVVRAGNQQQIN